VTRPAGSHVTVSCFNTPNNDSLLAVSFCQAMVADPAIAKVIFPNQIVQIQVCL